MGNGINVMELFAGVGGFRVGLEKADRDYFRTVWANQYEPSRKRQDAYNCYVHNFGEFGVSNEDISLVDEGQFTDIDMIVGGFPCFARGTFITTKNGIKNIEDIKEGEYVLTHKRRFRRVLKTMEKKKKGIYRLKVLGGNETLVTEEHPYYVREIKKDVNGKTIFSEPMWVEVKDLDKEKHFISMVVSDEREEVNFIDSGDFSDLGKYVASGIECGVTTNLGGIYKQALKDGRLLVRLQGFGEDNIKSFLGGYLSVKGQEGFNGVCKIREEDGWIAHLIGQLIQKVYKTTYSMVYESGEYIIEYRPGKEGEDVGNERDGYYIEGELYVPINELEYLDVFEGKVYNFEVEEDNSYVANNLTVHNCQDYSVARNSKGEEGIQGKKGVLFWDIVRFTESVRPKYLLLENVDRLLKSPSKQRGRDFGIMLSTLSNLGYTVEWRVITASDYGGVQKRKRVFIFAVKDYMSYVERLNNKVPYEILTKEGFFAKEFKVAVNGFPKVLKGEELGKDVLKMSNSFKYEFKNAGIVLDGKIYTMDVDAIKEDEKVLGDILERDVDEKYYLTDDQIERFKYLKGNKRIDRVSASGHKYVYTEGAMAFPDSLTREGRTMLTSEASVNRSTHVVGDKDTGRLRYLTPIECERLNSFPDNWTDSITDRMRYFTMGNALVVGLVERMGKRLKEIDKENRG